MEIYLGLAIFSVYIVGNGNNWSPVYNFRAMKEGNQWSPRFAVFGDMGVDNAVSLKFLEKEVLNGQFDAILHVGTKLNE